ncbi:MAG: hypothetical protein J6B30_03645 [Muribaculaceae bacterium]|nr:hypothetical protein [Muribaculaceae bacterium]
MKKILLGLTLLVSLGMNAQILSVKSTTKVAIPAGMKVSTAQLSPDGKWAVISHQSSMGLDKIDLSTNKLTRISDTDNGFDLKISGDNNTVIFRESNYGTDKRRYTTLKSVNISTGATKVVSPTTRDTRVFATDAAKALKANAGTFVGEATRPVASINRGSMYITQNGITTLVAPQGVEGKSYLWPQVSPDGKKILYFVVGEGCFVCNIDGSNPVAQGVLRASVWYDNNTIVGMDHKDDGVKTTSSKLIAKRINSSTTQVLTTSDVKAMYPSAGSNKISFVTPEGELYVINISK